MWLRNGIIIIEGLQAAVYHNHIHVVARLLQDKRIDAAHDSFHTIWQLVCGTGSVEMVRTFLSSGRADPTRINLMVIKLTILGAFLEHPSTNTVQILWDALQSRDRFLLRYVLSHPQVHPRILTLDTLLDVLAIRNDIPTSQKLVTLEVLLDHPRIREALKLEIRDKFFPPSRTCVII